MTLTEYAKSLAPKAKVLVLTKPNCPQCTATKRRLDKLGVSYTEEPIGTQTLTMAKAEGVVSAPIVVAPEVGVWGGFQPGKLDEIK